MVEWILFDVGNDSPAVVLQKEKMLNRDNYLAGSKYKKRGNKVLMMLGKLRKQDVHKWSPNMGYRSVSADLTYRIAEMAGWKVIESGFMRSLPEEATWRGNY